MRGPKPLERKRSNQREISASASKRKRRKKVSCLTRKKKEKKKKENAPLSGERGGEHRFRRPAPPKITEKKRSRPFRYERGKGKKREGGFQGILKKEGKFHVCGGEKNGRKAMNGEKEGKEHEKKKKGGAHQCCWDDADRSLLYCTEEKKRVIKKRKGGKWGRLRGTSHPANVKKRERSLGRE